jgi:hypothetical protein
MKGVNISHPNGVAYAGPSDGSAPRMPLVDPVRPLAFRPNSMDRKSGVAGSFTDCTLALAIKRMPGVVWVVVGRSIAYVGYADRTERYELTPKAKREVIANDITPLPALLASTGTIIFKPVRPTKTLVGKRATIAKHTARKASGTAKVTGPRVVKTDPLAAYGVRDGR